MKRLAQFALLLLLPAPALLAPAARGQAGGPAAPKSAPLVVKLGARSVNLPAPPGYEEGASQFPSLKEFFTKTEAAGNDLLAVYLPADVAETMRRNGGKYEGLRIFHGKVSVNRRFRETDVSAADFAQFVSQLKTHMPKILSADNLDMKNRRKRLEKTLGELGTG